MNSHLMSYTYAGRGKNVMLFVLIFGVSDLFSESVIISNAQNEQSMKQIRINENDKQTKNSIKRYRQTKTYNIQHLIECLYYNSLVWICSILHMCNTFSMWLPTSTNNNLNGLCFDSSSPVKFILIYKRKPQQQQLSHVHTQIYFGKWTQKQKMKKRHRKTKTKKCHAKFLIVTANLSINILNWDRFKWTGTVELKIAQIWNWLIWKIFYKKRKLVSQNEPVNATESFMMKSVHHETGLLINILRLFRLQISKWLWNSKEWTKVTNEGKCYDEWIWSAACLVHHKTFFDYCVHCAAFTFLHARAS